MKKNGLLKFKMFKMLDEFNLPKKEEIIQLKKCFYSIGSKEVDNTTLSKDSLKNSSM
jgi:hypothetical protein